jgi:hypothetical protein
VLANNTHFCHQEASLCIMATQQVQAFYVSQFAKLGSATSVQRSATSVLATKSPRQAVRTFTASIKSWRNKGASVKIRAQGIHVCPRKL